MLRHCWANVMLNARLTVKLRRHIGPDLVCVQEIGLHPLSRIVFKYQTTHDHKILASWRAESENCSADFTTEKPAWPVAMQV